MQVYFKVSVETEMLQEEDQSYHTQNKKIPKITELTFSLEVFLFPLTREKCLSRTESRCLTAQIKSDESHLAAAFVS